MLLDRFTIMLVQRGGCAQRGLFHSTDEDLSRGSSEYAAPEYSYGEIGIEARTRPEPEKRVQVLNAYRRRLGVTGKLDRASKSKLSAPHLECSLE